MFLQCFFRQQQIFADYVNFARLRFQRFLITKNGLRVRANFVCQNRIVFLLWRVWQLSRILEVPENLSPYQNRKRANFSSVRGQLGKISPTYLFRLAIERVSISIRFSSSSFPRKISAAVFSTTHETFDSGRRCI